jgi:hypothetical protein
MDTGLQCARCQCQCGEGAGCRRHADCFPQPVPGMGLFPLA